MTTLLDPKRSIPIVWGLWKTRLQLPKEALQWSDEQLQSVLLHELAHVRRRDLFVLALTQIASALHWFNPLVWIAAWRLHVERERACDDLVLNTGIRASSYAEHLLNVATRLTSSQWTQACGLAMARSSSLHGRLSAVLSEKQNRRSVTLAMTIMTLFCSLSVGIPMAMLRGADEVVQETPASQLIDETKPEETTADGRRVEARSGHTEPATVDAADDVVTATWDHIDLHKILRVDSLPEDLTNVLPESVKQLDGKRVRLRGYMYPTFEATGLTKFVISRDNAAMMLSHSPLLDQIVNVHLSADTDTNYIEGRPFDVEGIFRVKPAFDGNQKLSRLYHMEDAQIDLSLPGRKTTNSNRADSSPSRSPKVAAPEIGAFQGATIVAKVNGKPITVDDVLGGGRQIIEADSRLGENERKIVLRMAIQKRLRKYVDEEFVMQEMEKKIPQEERDSIRASLEPRFAQFLATIKKDHEFETDEELSSKLASEGNTISSLRELFMRSQMSDGYLLAIVKVPERFTREELRKHYEEHQSDYVVRRESDAENPRLTGITQPFDEVQKRVEQHLRRKLREEGRAKALEEIRSRSTVEVFVELKRDQDAEPKANANPVKHPDAHAVLQEGNPERTSEEQAIVASLLASETKRAMISLENSKFDLEAKRTVNKEHAEAYLADELKLAELEVAEKEAVLWHAVALLKEANLQKNAGGLTGDAKSLAEAKAAVRLAETNIARRRLATLELTQQLNQAANKKTPGTYPSEEMEKLALEIEKAKARIAELTGGSTEKPQAAKAPGSQVEHQGDLRIATHPGLFEIGDRVFLWVARKLYPDPDENGASLVRVSKEGKQIATDIPLPSGEGTWAAGWVRGGEVLWVAQKGKVTRYDFSDSEKVQTTDETQSSKGEAIPKELNNLLMQAIGEGGAAADGKELLQDRGEDPAASDEPRASLDQPESSSRRIVTWEDLAINATTLAEIRDEEMALDEVSEDLKTLNGKRIVVRGYMYPTLEATRLKKFVLVSDLFAASFVRKTSSDALVAVQIHDKNVTDFVEGREISVEGILRIDPRINREGELYQLYQLDDAQILQLHARTSMRKKGILVRPVSAEKSQEATPEYRAAFEHGEYDLGGGRVLRVRAIDQQQQSLTIEWPSNEPSQVYSWSMIPEAPHRADFRMSPEKPWSQTTGWGAVWHADSDTVWIADGSRRMTLNIAEPTAITVADSADNVAIEHAFREHIGMLARLTSRDEMRQFTLFLTPKVLEGALAKVKEQQEEDKRSADVRVEAAKLKKNRN